MKKQAYKTACFFIHLNIYQFHEILYLPALLWNIYVPTIENSTFYLRSVLQHT